MKKFTKWSFLKFIRSSSIRLLKRVEHRTGYRQTDLEAMLGTRITYEEFFRNAPELNENRKLIRGVVCGVRVENIEEPLMREIRYLDKLVDELAKGKSMEKILRK